MLLLLWLLRREVRAEDLPAFSVCFVSFMSLQTVAIWPVNSFRSIYYLLTHTHTPHSFHFHHFHYKERPNSDRNRWPSYKITLAVHTDDRYFISNIKLYVISGLLKCVIGFYFVYHDYYYCCSHCCCFFISIDQTCIEESQQQFSFDEL